MGLDLHPSFGLAVVQVGWALWSWAVSPTATPGPVVAIPPCECNCRCDVQAAAGGGITLGLQIGFSGVAVFFCGFALGRCWSAPQAPSGPRRRGIASSLGK